MKRSKNDTKTLGWTFNSIETHLHSLSSLGESVENNYLISKVKSKLPEEMNLKLEELKADEAWTTAQLRKSMNKLITACERTEDMYRAMTDDQNFQQYSGEGLLSREVRIKCILCNTPPWSECQVCKTIDQRKEKIRGICIVCLSSNHFLRERMVQKACFHCKRKGNHHSSLCPQKFAPTDDTNGDSEAATQ